MFEIGNILSDTADELQRRVHETGVERADFYPDRSKVLFTQTKALASQYTMDLAAVENWIVALGMLRTGMKPAVQPEWERTARVRAVRNPTVSVEADSLAGEALLHIRDARYGWLHIVFDKATAKKLGEALVAIADAPVPETKGHA